MELPRLERHRITETETTRAYELSYIYEYFDMVEINSSYYGPPRLGSAKK